MNCQCNDVDPGIVGCTPMGNPYISPISRGYLWVIIPKNPSRIPAKYHGSTRTLGIHPNCPLIESRPCVQISQPNLLQTDDSKPWTSGHQNSAFKCSHSSKELLLMLMLIQRNINDVECRYMTETSTSCSYNFIFRRKMHKLFNILCS